MPASPVLELDANPTDTATSVSGLYRQVPAPAEALLGLSPTTPSKTNYQRALPTAFETFEDEKVNFMQIWNYFMGIGTGKYRRTVC